MTSRARSDGGLYTPAVLGAAVALVEYPFDTDMAFAAEARSRSCGSRIQLSLDLDPDGRIVRLGIKPHACAIGQAAASLFARHASGQTRKAIETSRNGIASWLAGEGPEPLWPGIALLAPALPYPARHSAILLAWDAALAAMPLPSLETRQSEGKQDG